MQIYLIKEILEKTTLKEAKKREYPYVSIATNEEFSANSDFYDMGIDLEFDLSGPTTTKLEVNYDAVIGTFNIPDRKSFTSRHRFAYAFDEKGIVFIGEEDYVTSIIDRIIHLKKWRLPSLERFIFDFLEQITDEDLGILDKYEEMLNRFEDQIQLGECENIPDEVFDIRSNVNTLRLHYGQMLDLSQELEENENEFFSEANLRYFSMYSNRIRTLIDITGSLYEHCIQIRELLRSTIEAKQNRLMAILTLIATIFMPLTLIVGWYGMNFVYMPELHYRYAYPIVIGICLVIVLGCVVFFKKKKWL